MLRVLIKDITVSRGAGRHLNLHIRWQGGATETIDVLLPLKLPDAVRYPSALVDRIRPLAEDRDDREIARSPRISTAKG